MIWSTGWSAGYSPSCWAWLTGLPLQTNRESSVNQAREGERQMALHAKPQLILRQFSFVFDPLTLFDIYIHHEQGLRHTSWWLSSCHNDPTSTTSVPTGSAAGAMADTHKWAPATSAGICGDLFNAMVNNDLCWPWPSLYNMVNGYRWVVKAARSLIKTSRSATLAYLLGHARSRTT